MNVDDVNVNQQAMAKTTHGFFINIFTAQKKLMDKYHGIEAKNGCVVVDLPAHIDNAATQMRLKDMFWRTTEEIAEALENVQDIDFNGWLMRWVDDAAVRHFFEELADAMHFLIEASIIAGIEPTTLSSEAVYELARTDYDPKSAPSHLEIRLRCMDFITNLGLAANVLKNKPWKQTQIQTDSKKFDRLMVKTWISFLAILTRPGMTMAQIESLYFKKHAVNEFRQATNY